MAQIDDTGKVWFPGKFSPEYALRVGDKVFVPGKTEDERIHCWVAGDRLCVDCNDPANERRTARRLPLSLPPTQKATLFGGFENTKHADVHVVTGRDAGVEEVVLEKEEYRGRSLDTLDSASFWKLAFPEDTGS